jgi:hypothetical protein
MQRRHLNVPCFFLAYGRSTCLRYNGSSVGVILIDVDKLSPNCLIVRVEITLCPRILVTIANDRFAELQAS